MCVATSGIGCCVVPNTHWKQSLGIPCKLSTGNAYCCCQTYCQGQLSGDQDFVNEFYDGTASYHALQGTEAKEVKRIRARSVKDIRPKPVKNQVATKPVRLQAENAGMCCRGGTPHLRLWPLLGQQGRTEQPRRPSCAPSVLSPELDLAAAISALHSSISQTQQIVCG